MREDSVIGPRHAWATTIYLLDAYQAHTRRQLQPAAHLLVASALLATLAALIKGRIVPQREQRCPVRVRSRPSVGAWQVEQDLSEAGVTSPPHSGQTAPGVVVSRPARS